MRNIPPLPESSTRAPEDHGFAEKERLRQRQTCNQSFCDAILFQLIPTLLVEFGAGRPRLTPETIEKTLNASLCVTALLDAPLKLSRALLSLSWEELPALYATRHGTSISSVPQSFFLVLLVSELGTQFTCRYQQTLW